MNIEMIEGCLDKARREMLIVQGALESAHGDSRFNMFLPLVQRANTINSKMWALQEIIVDLKGVRCGQ